MKTGAFEQFLQAVEDAGNAIVRMLRIALRRIATMSWPALMATCVMLALLLTIVPLAFTLFLVFVAIKLVVGSCIVSRRRKHPETVEH